MPQPAPPLEALCSACGLCCDGTLFTHVSLTADEAERLAAKVEVRPRTDGKLALAQPCRALQGRSCAVYADRPQGCRTYVCSVYRALEGGEARADEAQELVALALGRIARVGAPLGPAAGPSPLVAARRALQAGGEAALSEEAHAAVRAAEQFLRFHFGWKG